MTKPVRQYSREFTPTARQRRRSINVDKVPADLYAAVRARAKRDGVSVRALVLSFLDGWSKDLTANDLRHESAASRQRGYLDLKGCADGRKGGAR